MNCVKKQIKFDFFTVLLNNSLADVTRNIFTLPSRSRQR